MFIANLCFAYLGKDGHFEGDFRKGMCDQCCLRQCRSEKFKLFI